MSAIIPSNYVHNIKKILGADFEKNPKMLIFGPFWDRLAQNPESQIFRAKSGSVSFHHLWSPDYMQEIRKILGAVFQNF